MDIEKLKYPIGHFSTPETITNEHRESWVGNISALPEKIGKATRDLTDEQLDTPYRPGGWTVRQLVHHVADSHMNAYVRFRLSLTEDNPTIKPYDEKAWAELPDSHLPIGPSLKILEGLHERWVFFLKKMSAEDLGRTFFHPGSNAKFNLDETIGTYAHHGEHHLAHIVNLRKRRGW